MLQICMIIILFTSVIKLVDVYQITKGGLQCETINEFTEYFVSVRDGEYESLYQYIEPYEIRIVIHDVGMICILPIIILCENILYKRKCELSK